ncbi:MAG: DUF1071 domain-containing protein [Clostridia bacterium]|nr:DUF1071 domain-containing protein [Clostridia bacterium]
MLKSFNEMRKIDVSPYVKQRDGADYLPWATVVDLLHEHGAERVFFTPIYNENGSSLFMSEQTFTDNKCNTNRCYEVRIEVVVDDDSFIYSYPLLNGINPVKDNSLNQNVVFKAMARAFVKAIALRYGLGFSLWSKDELEAQEDDIYKHSIRSIEERVQQAYTRLIRKGMTTKEIAAALNKTEDEIKVLFTFFSQIDRFEQDLLKL